MGEVNKSIKKRKANLDQKIRIPVSPFLQRFGYGEDGIKMRISRCPEASIRSPEMYKIMCRRVKPMKVQERVKAEAELLRRLAHPNIVRFRQYSSAKRKVEGCDVFLGDMIAQRVEPDYEPFQPKQVLKVAADIASALDYLHTKKQILHGDIKSYNILVKGDFEICKLCDFEVCLPLNEHGVLDKEKARTEGRKSDKYYGSREWRAPEVVNKGEITSKSDVWALGLTLWEMMTLVTPHAELGCPCGAVVLAEPLLLGTDGGPFYNLHNYIDKMSRWISKIGTRPKIPVNVPEKQFMYPLTLFYWCTEASPAARVTAQHLSAAATDMLHHLTYGIWLPHLAGTPLCEPASSTVESTPQ
ncbi:hypothetical protein PYW07_003558 [Mythimna separata]|uniref:non-specific serine/threonine protein kinase n=1 Tax=Mythimna separata TaxID=271217 RepID=A0AAD7YNH7_MYTSE|nr:hypothetical protein PYW07_003558 [Mythimna separata]